MFLINREQGDKSLSAHSSLVVSLSLAALLCTACERPSEMVKMTCRSNQQWFKLTNAEYKKCLSDAPNRTERRTKRDKEFSNLIVKSHSEKRSLLEPRATAPSLQFVRLPDLLPDFGPLRAREQTYVPSQR